MKNQKTIPKIIHYVWIGGKNKSIEVLQNIESWKKYCPNYEIKEWNEENFDINSIPYVKEAYEHKKYAFVSDYIRIFALYTEGGVYFDTDIELYRNIDELLENDFFASFENRVAISLSAIGSKKNNQIVKDILNSYNRRNFIVDGKPDLTTNVILGTVLLKEKYNIEYNGKTQRIENQNATIYATEYFTPMDYITKKEVRTVNTYGIHKYSGSWLTEKQIKSNKLVCKISKFFGEKAFNHIEYSFLKNRMKKYHKKLKEYLK